MTRYRSPFDRRTGRFTPAGILQPTPPRGRKMSCQCPVCAAERRGVPFDRDRWWAGRQSKIDRHGMVIQYVAASPGGHPWAYTIGRLSRGRPELVVVGLSVESSAAMLNGIDAEWDAISIPEDGMCTIPSTPSHRFGIVPIPDALWESEYLLGALRYAVEQGLADRLSALQVIWCGPDGVFPWDPEIDEELRRSQPILGLRVSEV